MPHLGGARHSSTERRIQMIAESTNSSIIPSHTVKCAMFCLLDGLPVEAREFGVSPVANATAEDFMDAFKRLFTAEREVTIRSRFQTGDLWNFVQRRENSALRLRIIALTRQSLSIQGAERRLQKLRDYGWVAAKWPEARRSDKHGWTYYVKNKVGAPIVKESPYGLDPLNLLDATETDSGLMLHYKTNGDKEYMAKGILRVKVTRMDGREEVCELILRPVNEASDEDTAD